MTPTWYLAKNIKPVEHEDVLMYDYDAHYIAYWVSGGVGAKGHWYDAGGRVKVSSNAYWTDLPRPT
jgi:hypothetical protein